MPWLRVSDTVAHDPIVVAVLEHPDSDDRTADELFGYVLRLATLSAQHTTDYITSYATALSLAGTKARADRLLLLAEFAGYGWNEVEEDSGRRRFRLKDDPKFIHMKTAEEVAWEAQRKQDNANPHITALVRLRDGDACRYCGKVVNWSDRTGGMGGTYDHRPPGMPATAETMVVACKKHNSERGQASQGLTGQAALEAADEVLPLWDVPLTPYYKPATRAWLQKQSDVLTQHGLKPPAPATTKKTIPAGNLAPGVATPPPAPAARPSSAGTAPQSVRPAAPARQDAQQPAQRANGSADTAPAPERPAAPQTPAQHPAPDPRDPAADSHLQIQQVDGLPELEIPGRVGTGRVGAGLAGTGRGGAPRGGGQPGGGRRGRRGRRGGRNRSKPQSNPQQQTQPQSPLSREDHTR